MQIWVALFRSINVGGRNRLPMAQLAQLLESINCKDLRTYIQSGNVVFRSRAKNKARLTTKVLDAVENEFGFRPQLLLLTASDFLNAKKGNPFPKAIDQPKTLHCFFLGSKPDSPGLDGIAQLADKSESYELSNDVFYLHAPNGFGKSKLAAAAERKLGVTTTARNYSTIQKISELIADTQSI